MATITLEYDGRNPIARKTIDFVLSLGIFHCKEHNVSDDEAAPYNDDDDDGYSPKTDLYEIPWDDEIRGKQYTVITSHRFPNMIIWTNPDTGKVERISRIGLCWQTKEPLFDKIDMRAVLK